MKIAITILSIFINFVITAQHGRISDTYDYDEEPISIFTWSLVIIIIIIFIYNNNKAPKNDQPIANIYGGYPDEEVSRFEHSYSIDEARFFIKKMKKQKKKARKILINNAIKKHEDPYSGLMYWKMPCRILKYYRFETYENGIDKKPYKKALIEFINVKKVSRLTIAITYDLSYEEEIIYSMENDIPLISIAEKNPDKEGLWLQRFSHLKYVDNSIDNNDLFEDFTERKIGFIDAIYKIIDEYAFQEGIRLIDKMIKVNKYRVDSEFYELRAECNEGLFNYQEAVNDINNAIKLLSEHFPIDYKSYIKFLEIRSGFKKELEDFDGATEDIELAQSYQTKLS